MRAWLVILPALLFAGGCRLPFSKPMAPFPSVTWRSEVLTSLKPGEASWTMVDVTEATKQADSHLLEFPDQTRVLIDTGFTGNKILPYLASRGLKKIDIVLISHPHNDHYGGLRPLLSAGVSVGKVIFNMPDRIDCDAEKPWGCKWEDLQDLVDFIKAYKVPVEPALPGNVIHRTPEASLEVLYAFDHASNPAYPAPLSINDTSLICLLRYGKSRALFTGDLNRPIGAHLAKIGKNLEADILKVPHHGTEGVAPNEFFDRVGPRFALVPAPHELWHSDRSKRIRDYFVAQKKIPTYVSGDNGDVTVLFTKDVFHVSSAR